MNTVEAAKYIQATISDALAEINFVPPLPPKRAPRIRPDADNVERVDPHARGDSSAWTIFIEYVDSTGWVSARRITILRFEHRVGELPAIAAMCHECGEHRLFRCDRIREIVDIATGEVLDVAGHLALLQRQGLPKVNRGMYSFCRVLAFIARCDGSFDRLEHDAIEVALTSYALRFDGDSDDIENTMAAVKNMVPDTTDLANALIAILRSPREIRLGVADLLLRCIADIIDADGIHAIEEISWALALKECLMIIRPRSLPSAK